MQKKVYEKSLSEKRIALGFGAGRVEGIATNTIQVIPKGARSVRAGRAQKPQVSAVRSNETYHENVSH